MTELLRDIGSLGARMDDHDRRFDQLEKKMDVGFSGIYQKLDELKGAENRRRGAMGVIKAVLGAGGLAGLWELAKAWLHR